MLRSGWRWRWGRLARSSTTTATPASTSTPTPCGAPQWVALALGAAGAALIVRKAVTRLLQRLHERRVRARVLQVGCRQFLLEIQRRERRGKEEG